MIPASPPVSIAMGSLRSFCAAFSHHQFTFKGSDMKTVSKVFQAMLTKETTPVWAGRAATPVDGPTAMFTWEPDRRKVG
jgi:hypothetical protein